jgi:hypothetical protein
MTFVDALDLIVYESGHSPRWTNGELPPWLRLLAKHYQRNAEFCSIRARIVRVAKLAWGDHALQDTLGVLFRLGASTDVIGEYLMNNDPAPESEARTWLAGNRLALGKP